MADHPPAMNRSVRFGVFEIDPSARELRKLGVRIKLQEQPLAVLLMLLEKPGQLVTREELQQRLWPADTFVEFDKGIYNAVKRLRETLGDEAGTPRYIETLPRRGYRFIGPVNNPMEEPRFVGPLSNHAAVASPSPTPASSTSEIQSERRPYSRKVAVAIALCLGLLCAIGAWTAHRVNNGSPLSRLEVVPVASMRGFQATPAFSPDGSLLAFRHPEGINYVLVNGHVVIDRGNHTGERPGMALRGPGFRGVGSTTQP